MLNDISPRSIIISAIITLLISITFLITGIILFSKKHKRTKTIKILTYICICGSALSFVIAVFTVLSYYVFF